MRDMKRGREVSLYLAKKKKRSLALSKFHGYWESFFHKRG